MPETTTQTFRVSDELELTWAGVTDRGRRRENNQDSFLAKYPLFIVADGMGGHAGGEIASQATVDRLSDMVDAGRIDDERIIAALQLAVDDIHRHPDTTDEGTGTTLTGVYLDRGEDGSWRWISLNIGDSRVYLERDGRLIQVTTDHSVVQELIASGKISPEEADAHPYSNVITRAVGANELVSPDYVAIDVVDGDRFIICSDGLTKELTDYGILHFLRENDEPADAVSAMVDAALENGGRDNVTLIVLNVRYTGASEDPADEPADDEPADDEQSSSTDGTTQD
ncbi:serine/threonine-protein phosphatase [Microbacterium esteraromaticum]|uniref:Serine/threonine-protein phosphatase n=1 Tax=Microbacterium esteraromaticum TaxID=57043 RepID=A0A7D8AKQ0_9MICO|nr:protein phosphatase 2C domain-containing protein [Microbacterium esteraromaticum]QMU97889.1 serine/threonine-protein phosphatase [Microbacterium esteraromaticum]